MNACKGKAIIGKGGDQQAATASGHGKRSTPEPRQSDYKDKACKKKFIG
jgi:hypothetical protein